jgi:hypothetical protein
MRKQHELASAINEYTGGRFTPDMREEAWQNLAKRLQESKYSAAEFCYWVCHFVEPDHAPANHLLLRKHYVASSALWEQFVKFKKTRVQDINLIVKIQREALSTLNKVYGISPEHLLTEGMLTMNPILRVDYALMQLANGRGEYQKVVDKYLDEATYQLKGSPEYLPHGWFLAKLQEVQNVSGDKE